MKAIVPLVRKKAVEKELVTQLTIAARTLWVLLKVIRRLWSQMRSKDGDIVVEAEVVEEAEVVDVDVALTGAGMVAEDSTIRIKSPT